MTIPTGHAFVGNRGALENGQAEIGLSTGILTASRWETLSIQPQDMLLYDSAGYPYYDFASSTEFGGLVFPNDDDSARARGTATFLPSRKLRSRIYPYMRYVQTSASDTYIILEVVLAFPGSTDWFAPAESFIMGVTKIYPYISGNMLQTTISFPRPFYPIDPLGDNDTIGAEVYIEVKNTVTGSGETKIIEIGFYYEIDSFGSSGQRSK